LEEDNKKRELEAPFLMRRIEEEPFLASLLLLTN